VGAVRWPRRPRVDLMSNTDPQRYYLPLLEEHVTFPPGGRVLEMGYYDPQVALWAGGEGARVVALRPAIDQVAELEQVVRESGLTGIEVRLALRPEADELGTFDVALLLAPFFLGNVPVRQAMAAAAGALEPEGRLYFQGHKRRGSDTFVGYARDLFQSVTLLGMGGGQRRLYLASRPRPEAVAAAGAGAAGGDEAAVTPLEVTLRGTPLKLRLAAGVFSAHRVDPGSRLLAETAEVPPGGRVLDLGCGAGTIGLALAAADPRARVILADASRPAVELAQENAATNRLQNVEVRLSDGYAALAGQRFDAVVSNLPAHRGQQADSGAAHRFIAEAPAHLRDGGAAWFVANRALPYELPASRAFRQVRVAAADGQYKVLHCEGPLAGSAVRRRDATQR
jgi:16S rRNA (guanine1207-N2)-methyltransferase